MKLHSDSTGKKLTISTVGESCEAFLPDPLPPRATIEIDLELLKKMEEAQVQLGRLDSIATLLPDVNLFLFMYVRKEAVLSSQIEGTQSSLSDLFLYELDEEPGVPVDDVKEVSSYISALNLGLQLIREGYPISIRLIKNIHKELLHSGRGEDKNPGEIRRSQNWIGGTRPGNAIYVPPPHGHVSELMSNFEKFANDAFGRQPLMIKAALLHAQFETIHPFLDGNGRIGRLLITLLFCKEGILKEPLLYLSLFFKRNRLDYYDLLQRIRTHGKWREWLDFFIDGVTQTCNSAINTAHRIQTLFENDKKSIESTGDRTVGNIIRVHETFKTRPITTIKHISSETGLSTTTTGRCVARLEELGIISKASKRRWKRFYSHRHYLDLLTEGTETL